MKKIRIFIFLAILIIICIAIRYNTSKIERFTIQRRPLRIGIGSFWEGFDPSYNFFTLLCSHYGKYLKSGPRDGIGIHFSKLEEGNEDIDLYISTDHTINSQSRVSKLKKGIPFVHFTGEAWTPRVPEANLELGFHYDNSDSYMRLPLWYMYINWFNADIRKLGNPKPCALERVTQIFPNELAAKKNFCIFIVSNGSNQDRNNAFDWISSYKHVDSAGRHKNNMGDVIPAGSGGAEDAKLTLMKSYKFNICYENKIQPGYVTEKILQAKAAGCIPIYLGDPMIKQEFDVRGFIDARNANTKEKLIALVKEVDTNNNLYIQKYSIPLLSRSKEREVRQNLANLAKRLWSFVLPEEEFTTCPKQI
jgi:hypothetical protein